MDLILDTDLILKFIFICILIIIFVCIVRGFRILISILSTIIRYASIILAVFIVVFLVLTAMIYYYFGYCLLYDLYFFIIDL